MQVSKESTIALALLASTLVANAIGLAPELTIGRQDRNDGAMHYPLVRGMVHEIEHGDYPFDFWAPESSLGYPVLRTYQPLAHAIVAATYFALFKHVALITVFVWVRYLAVVLVPLTFFVTARLLLLPPITAAAAAILSALVSTPGLYGLESSSYLWVSFGLFTQAVAGHFALLTIGLAFRAIRGGRLLAVTGVLLGLTFLAHFVYGYIAGLTICLIALLPAADTALRVRRTIRVGAIALLVSAFELVPLLLDGAIINHSRYEPLWKWDSVGALGVMGLLLTGDLLDHGRLPLLTILALAGVVFYFRDVMSIHKRRTPAETFIVLGAILWILMFFGRPFWGRLLILVGVLPDMPLHRLIGGVQIFLVLIAAIQLSFLWQYLLRKTHVAVAALAMIVLLFPMVRERENYLADNRSSGYSSLAAYEADHTAVDHALDVARERGGRVYAGPSDGWGKEFKIGGPPVYAYLNEAGVPEVSFLYHSMSLPSDLMQRFDMTSEAQYRLFDVRTVMSPADGSVGVPHFLASLPSAGPIAIYAAPGRSHFDVVDAPIAVKITRHSFYDINDRWLRSDWVQNGQYLLLDFGQDPDGTNYIRPDSDLPPSRSLPPPGAVLQEQQSGSDYEAEIEAARSCYLLFKETWHPNWRALVDGQPVSTVMLSPGFAGVPVTMGKHRVSLRYQPEKWQPVLAAGGILGGLLLIAIEQRRNLPTQNPLIDSN
jgi:hypothetical protein